MQADNKLCLLIPFYNHETFLENMVNLLKEFHLPCFIINDGSHPRCEPVLKLVESKHPWVTVVNRSVNGGKGAAVITGFNEARKAGFTHVLQIDADCQHDVTQIPALIACSANNPSALILGQAVYGDDVPKSRLYGRYITHFWVMIETLSWQKLDTMCGLRIYPLEKISSKLLDNCGMRMDFDIEISVRLIWQNCQVIKLPVKVCYPAEGVSHFHYFKSNVRISWMHTRLFFGMLLRLPLLVARKFSQ